MPKAEEFLATAQPAPEAYLMDGVPSSVTMQSWSYINTSGKYHNETNPVLQAIQFGQMIEDALEDGNLDENLIGPNGIGKFETLAIDGVGSLTMPPHLAFGKPATLKDTSGNAVAVILTAQKTRPKGMFSSAVNVYGVKPQFAGQQMAPGVTNGYLWASVKRAPFTKTVKVFNGKNEQIGTGYWYGGWRLNKNKFETMSKQGLMLSTPNATDKEKTEIQCAPGVDTAFAICLSAALQIANDELMLERRGNDDDHGPGGD